MFDKKRIILHTVLLAFLLEGCVTVDTFNAQVNSLRNVKDLKSDVEFVQYKLEKLHPDLYHYISKRNLEYKFDSLKSSLISPLTSYDFYFKLSPVIASIKQGHTQMFPLTKKLTSKEKKIVSKNGMSPLEQFDFELFDKKLYIIKNNSKDSTIKAGTELCLINGEKPIEIITKYRKTITSDGDNTTFILRRLGKGFPRYFYYEHGINDSLICQLSFTGTVRTITLTRPEKPKLPIVKKTKEQTVKDRELQKKEQKKRKLFGYDPLKRIYSKLLTFPVKDSSIAVIKISDFMKGNYRKFYKSSFQLMNTLHTKSIILDLRDNGGGHIRDINTLYSYLADSSFHLIEKSEVTSKTSLWHVGYYNDQPILIQALQTILLPVVVGIDIFTYLKITKGIDHKYYYALRDSKLTHPATNHFKGKVYVIINGGSFSASSLLSSNLKNSKRATFVGQETGGADNGCVAGILPVRTLPASKIKIRFGLLECQTPYKSKMNGRGIFPDMEITPTLKDRINGNDPEIQWVLNDINKTQKPSK